MKTEAILQEQVANYLALQYPDVIFHSDYGSGAKLTMGQAARQKRMNGGRKYWPDMFIAKPSAVDIGIRVKRYAGLFLELKREDVKLQKKDGSWATEHIAKQADMLMKLRSEGYSAEFACGFDEAKEVIDDYLKAR